MKLHRIVSLMLVLLFALCACAQAGAVTDSWSVDNAYVTLNEKTGVLVIQSREDGRYTLAAADGTPLTDPYLYMDANDTMFDVATEEGLNVFGMIDSTGKLVVPMQYGDTVCLSDRWQLGVVLEEATAENYDYKTFDGKTFYLISRYDVYYQGQKAGELGRLEYRNAYPYGAYLYVSDEERNYACYDSTMTASSYVPSFSGSSEYDETRDGVFHKGSGQQVGVPGCTLTSDDVEEDIFLIDGRFVDLQGNVTFAADAKYESIYDFEGDYAKVRMNGKYGLIDRTGREVMACEYDEITYGETYFEGGYQIAVKDGKVGFVNTSGETTCEFKYASNIVKSTYKMPMTHLADLDGSIIVLSGAAGELDKRFAEVRIANSNGCPLFAGEPEEKKAGVYTLFGEEIIPADGKFDDVYDLNISHDGSVVVGYDTDRKYHVYLIDTSAFAAAEPEKEAEAPAQEAGESAAEPEGWTCSCGSKNSGKFCPECGSPRPEQLKCAKCGFTPAEGTTPKFCSECGNAF
ncbi:MAG: WG repeat-containing protein [Clostridia bacterium]|nr:WG repeat-containing protein [Clostridia bacterium]